MSLLAKFKKKLFNTTSGANTSCAGCGILLFAETGDVLFAEKLIRKAGITVAIKAPPPHLRKGCDMLIEYPLMAESVIRTLMADAKLEPLQYYKVSDELMKPVSIFSYKDYGQYLMVRAANMKVTIDKKNLCIVNVSGGGCPDVPYLAAQIIGQKLEQIILPEQPDKPDALELPFGHKHITLCGYALHLAINEAHNLLQSDKQNFKKGDTQ
jgi:hypothetical protein